LQNTERHSVVMQPLSNSPRKQGEKKASSPSTGRIEVGLEDQGEVDKGEVDLHHWQVSPALWEKLKPLARQMRKNPTSAEKLLWTMLRKKQVMNIKFRRQHVIERFIVDFYNSDYGIIIEVDGDIHQYQKEEDAIRQEFLEDIGYVVIRFTNDEVFGDMDKVITKIEEVIKATTPRPSPQAVREQNARKANLTSSPSTGRIEVGSKRVGVGSEIQKEDIFHYTYAVLHNPAYRKKYELNLKREFPRLPFYEDFWQWRDWGKQLMDLHINFEQAEKFPLKQRDTGYDKAHDPKAKLRADKANGIIILDEQTELHGVPKEAWDYKLGNRSALEWILDQYKEKKPRDPTIREKFNTYRFADYKDKVIELLMRVCTVSVETMQIVNQMKRGK
ncbi:type ISP restriction/modification enzyme, partial [Bacteroidota bacterium]